MAIKYLSINNETLNISELVRLTTINNLGANGRVTFQNGPSYQALTGYYNIYVIPELKGTKPTTTYYRSMTLADKTKLDNISEDSNSLAKVELQYRTDGQTRAQLMAYKPSHDDSTFAYLAIGWMENSNTAYTYCPSPANTSNNNEIATTQWVRQYLSSKGIS